MDLSLIAAAAAAVATLVATPFLAWWSGVWFRARGAASGTFTYGFPGSTLDRLICAGLLTAPWPVVAALADDPGIASWPWPAFDAATIAVLLLLNLAAVSLAHGNYFSLGERSAAASKSEPPMSWLLGREPPGLDESDRTGHQVKGAAIRIAIMALPSVVAAAALAGAWLAALAILLPLAWLVARIAANARRNPAYAQSLKRTLRVARWPDDAGMRPGWELLEFMAGGYAGAVSGLAAAASLAVLAASAWAG